MPLTNDSWSEGSIFGHQLVVFRAMLYNCMYQRVFHVVPRLYGECLGVVQPDGEGHGQPRLHGDGYRIQILKQDKHSANIRIRISSIYKRMLICFYFYSIVIHVLLCILTGLTCNELLLLRYFT